MSERFKQSHSIPACNCLGGLWPAAAQTPHAPEAAPHRGSHRTPPTSSWGETGAHCGETIPEWTAKRIPHGKISGTPWLRPQPCYSSPGHGGGGDTARSQHSWRGGKVSRVFLYHVSNPSEKEGSMTVSSIYDHDKARPSGIHHMWPWGSESRSQHIGVRLPGTPSHTVHEYLHFLFVFFHSPFSRGKSPTGAWRSVGSSGCSLAMAPNGTELGHSLSASSGCKTEKKYSRLCSPAFLHLYIRLGNLPTPPSTKHPPVSVGQETPAQCRARLLTLKMY